MQNRTFHPYLAAIHRISVPAMLVVPQDIEPGALARPQLAQACETTAKAFRIMSGKDFVVETKFDGAPAQKPVLARLGRSLTPLISQLASIRQILWYTACRVWPVVSGLNAGLGPEPCGQALTQKPRETHMHSLWMLAFASPLNFFPRRTHAGDMPRAVFFPGERTQVHVMGDGTVQWWSRNGIEHGVRWLAMALNCLFAQRFHFATPQKVLVGFFVL
jgi:hypothetical protein